MGWVLSLLWCRQVVNIAKSKKTQLEYKLEYTWVWIVVWFDHFSGQTIDGYNDPISYFLILCCCWHRFWILTSPRLRVSRVLWRLSMNFPSRCEALILEPYCLHTLKAYNRTHAKSLLHTVPFFPQRKNNIVKLCIHQERIERELGGSTQACHLEMMMHNLIFFKL